MLAWGDFISKRIEDKMKIKLVISIAIVSFVSCGSSMVEPPDAPVMPFEIEWSTRMDINKDIVGTDNIFIFGDQLLVGGDIDDPPTVLQFGISTGTKNGATVLSDVSEYRVDEAKMINNVYIGRSGDTLFGLDMDNDNVLWKTDFGDMEVHLHRGIVSDGIYYQVAYLNFDPLGGGKARIYEINPQTGDFRLVFEKAANSIGTTSVSPPIIYNITESDMPRLIFNEFPNAEAVPQEATQYITSVDLDSGDILWRTKVTDIFASNSLHPPVIYDDRIVITGGQHHIFGFDVHTGEQLWKYTDTDALGLAQWANTNHLIYEDRLYVNETGESVTCLNPETGALIWDNPKGGANCTDNMHYYEKEDLLVFCSWGYGSIMVLDALTGETIHREYEYDFSPFGSDVVYDEDLDLFFSTTYKHAVAFKVRRPE